MRRRPRGRGRSVDRGTCGPGIEPRKAITSGCRRRRRMRKADKTRLIEFGPFAAENRRRRGEGKPETFDFLGFTHICGTKGSNGRFTVLRQTMRERLQAKLGQVKIELRRRLHDPVPEVGSWLRSVVGGHLRYYGVPMNSRAISLFRLRVGWLWNRSMRRRSQKTRLTWERMSRLIDHWLPPPRVCHPYPLYRLGVIPEASWRIILIHPTPSGEPSHAARTCQRLGGHRRSPSTGHCADCHHGAASSIRQACYGRDHPVNDSEVTDGHRRPATALTVVMALHHRSVEPRTVQSLTRTANSQQLGSHRPIYPVPLSSWLEAERR